ncbi:MAG: type 1 glutamine amidotransferase [Spirochaetes bacterium]|nr:type 1 glutamine amidotransferase [Spirochaetota bacterium]
MRIHYLQHVSFEGPGYIADWANDHGHSISCTRIFESEKLPDHDMIDLLVIMGGPMSVNDENKFPWLASEKKFIREAINAGKSVLGICLGAQLIASAMGSSVYKNDQKEIGWFPVYRSLQAYDSSFEFPESISVFHWHGETFDLPRGAVHLAVSRACINQAFSIGRSVIGLQFHLETTPESMRSIVLSCRNDLIPSEYVQTEQKILSVKSEDMKSINYLMGQILSFLLYQK